jgi:hypothetical protein
MINEIEIEIEAGTRDGQGVEKMGKGKFEILNRELFGEAHRYRVERCRDRFDSIVYMTFDAELADPVTGGPACIRQSESLDLAVAGLADEAELSHLRDVWSLR